MRRIIIFGVTLLTTFSIVAVDAVSVSASGHEFIASKTGTTKSKQTNLQVFKIGVGVLECEQVSGSGEIKKGESTDHKEVFTYKECFAFSQKVTVSPADFDFNANGSVTLENTVTVEPINDECTLKIEPQTIEHANYKNESGGKVSAEAAGSKIHSKGSGGGCGNSTNTEGTYTGAVLGEVEGGTIEWK